MGTDFSIASRFRNKAEVKELIRRLEERGYSCYDFTTGPADPNNPEADPEVQMKVFESTENFTSNEYFKYLFEKDLKGLREAEKMILLLPAGTSAHIEIGIAYGLGKECILIGEPEKPESLYLLFHKYYADVDSFIDSLS